MAGVWVDGAVFSGLSGDTANLYWFEGSPLEPLSGESVGPSGVKTINGLAVAYVKTVLGLSWSDVKSWNGLE